MEWAIILTTLLSPLIAVQVTKWLAKKSQQEDEKKRLFKTLMATRATTLNPHHVEALNLIDVVFCGNNKDETEIRLLWKEYLAHLSEEHTNQEAWNSKKEDLSSQLLNRMGEYLGYKIDKTHIKKQAYLPVGHSELEKDQAKIRAGIVEVLCGQRALPILLVNMPANVDANAATENERGAP